MGKNVETTARGCSIVKSESIEHDVLVAAVIVQRQLVSVDQVVAAAARWTEAETGSLLTCIEEIAGVGEMDRQHLRSAFAEFHRQSTGAVCELLTHDDFVCLGEALAVVDNPVLQASVSRWHRINTSRSNDVNAQSANDRFHVVYAIGDTGATEILLLEDRQLGRRLRLERVRSDMLENERAVAAFRRETEFLLRLQHPCVPLVLALDVPSDGCPSRVTPLHDMPTLSASAREFHRSVGQYRDSAGTQEFHELMQHFVAACRTVDFAHTCGVARGALSGNDILVGPFGETLLINWGASEELSDSLAEGRTQKFADLKQLALVLQTVVTGNFAVPDSNGSADEAGAASPPRSNKRRLDDLLQLSQMAHSDDLPEECRTPEWLADKVNLWLADRPLIPGNEPATLKAARWGRENHARAAAVFLGLICLVLLSFITAWEWSDYQRLRLDASRKEMKQKMAAELQREIRLNRSASAIRQARIQADAQIRMGLVTEAADTLRQVRSLATNTSATLASEAVNVAALAVPLGQVAEFYQTVKQVNDAELACRHADQLALSLVALSQLGISVDSHWWVELDNRGLDADQTDRLCTVVHELLCRAALAYLKLQNRVATDLPSHDHPADATASIRSAAIDRDTVVRLVNAAHRYEPLGSMEWLRQTIVRPSGAFEIEPPDPAAAPRSVLDAVLWAEVLMDGREQTPQGSAAAVQTERLSAASKLLSESVAAQPSNLQALLTLARIQYQQAEQAAEHEAADSHVRFQLVLQTLGRCVAHHPESGYAAIAFAAVQLREADVAGTLTSDKSGTLSIESADLLLQSSADATALVPAFAASWWGRGNALMVAGNRSLALEAWNRAAELELSPKFPPLTCVAAPDWFGVRSRAADFLSNDALFGDVPGSRDGLLACLQLIEGDSTAARTFADAANQAGDASVAGLLVLGLLDLQAGDDSLALEHFLNCTDKVNAFQTVSAYAGICLERLGRHNDALLRYRQAESQAVSNPACAETLLGQVRSLMMLRQSVNAVTPLMKARELNPACDLTSVLELARRINDRSIVQAIGELSGGFVPEQPRREMSVSIRNSGFELPLKRHWQLLSGHSETLQTSAAVQRSRDASDGKFSLRVQTSGKSGRPVELRQDIVLESGKPYEMTVWLKTVQAGTGKLDFFVEPPSGGSGPVATVHVNVSPGDLSTRPWEAHTYSFRTDQMAEGPAATTMTLRISISGNCDVLIDQLHVYEVRIE